MAGQGHYKRIGVLGGTFDPVHNGHIFIAEAAILEYALDIVLLTPAAQQWQKGEHASAVHRLNMLDLAIQGHEKLAISDVDIVRGGETYTVDTLQDIARKYSPESLFFILGADAYAGISTWKNHEKLRDLCEFIVVNRGDSTPEFLGIDSSRVNLLKTPAVAVSSSQCRDRIEQGLSREGLVPTQVEEYIEDQRLYRRIS